MIIENYRKELIGLEVIKVLFQNFQFLEKTNAGKYFSFHEAFLKAFSDKLENIVANTTIFISLSSWLHGLSTSLGQSFFEKTGKILCDGEKKEFKNLKISQNQQTKISEIIAELKNGERTPNLSSENHELFDIPNPPEKEIGNFTADIYYEDNTSITAIELKTVKPNSSIFKAEKTKLLEAKAALKHKYPEKSINYLLAFPFDPLSATSTDYNKERFHTYSVDFKKYFSKDEFLLAGEFWDFLSGTTNTMENILEMINLISTTEFNDRFDFIINQSENMANNSEKYIELLDNWYLYSEKELMINYDVLQQNALNDKKIARILNQSPFDRECKYNVRRYHILRELL